ncbi:hypothetical protein BH10ACI1_BH10ACI1_29800 [soil metagenome]
MLKKLLFTIVYAVIAIVSINAQTTQSTDTAMILPFENSSNKGEFNWVGESLADSLSDLLKVPNLNVITNQERKIIQQRLRVPLTILPSLATSLKLAREGKATLLVAGKYDIQAGQDGADAKITVSAKIIRVNEGRFLSEEFDGKSVTRDIRIDDALGNLQNIQGEIAYVILYQLFKSTLTSSRNDLVNAANKVPARAFEAYIKGLLTSEADLQTRENFLKNAMRIYADDEKTKGGIYGDAALELGHLFLNQRKFPEAVTYFSQVPQTSPQYAEAAFYTGLIYWQQQNFEQALAVLRPLADDLKLTSVYNTLGAIAVQASRAEKRNKGNADKLMQEGLEFLKKAAESTDEGSNAKFNYGLALYLNNNFLDAAKLLRPVLAINSRDGEAYFLLAKTLERLGDTTAADFDNQARRFLTENNRYAKLETDWKAGKTDGISLRVEQPARKDFVSVILIKKQSTPTQTKLSETETLLAQAQTLYNSGNDDEAMTVLRKVLVSEPMSAQAYLLLGMIHLRRGDLDQATSSLKTALFWDNRLIEAHVALGRIYVQKGDCQAGQTYAASAAAIDAENQDVTALKRQVERCSTK